MPDFWVNFMDTLQSSNVAMFIGVGAVMLLVIGGLSTLSHMYTLNGIKSRTVGDGQHGTARWATKKRDPADLRPCAVQGQGLASRKGSPQGAGLGIGLHRKEKCRHSPCGS